MPLHVARLTESALAEVGTRVHGATLAVLGYAYLENSDDTRNSPTAALVHHLKAWGANVRIHDPWVAEYNGEIQETLSGADAVIIMVAHDEYRRIDWSRAKGALKHPVLVDGRYVVESADAKALGFAFRGVGRG
jgi:UDP-N-acetyl-D-mannosaminuronic acid dehydrogenase